MPEPKKEKYDIILGALMNSIRARDGEEKLVLLRDELRQRVREGTLRESVVQIIAKEGWLSRMKTFILYPELIVPYFNRIKRPKS